MEPSELNAFKELLSQPTQADYEKVLEMLLEQMFAERGCMWLERENAFIYHGDEELRKTFPFSRQAVDAVLADGCSFISFDSSQDERIPDSGSIVMNKMRSCLCSASTDADGNVLVLAYFDNSMNSGPFSEADLQSLRQVLALVPGAMALKED